VFAFALLGDVAGPLPIAQVNLAFSRRMAVDAHSLDAPGLSGDLRGMLIDI